MRSPRPHDDRVAQVTQRRLEVLAAELAALRQSSEPGHGVEGAGLDTDPDADPDSAVPVVPLDATAPPGQLSGRHAHRPLRPAARITGWLADRMPDTMRGTIHLGSAQLGLVALVVAVGLVATAWWVVRAGGTDAEVVPPRPVTAGPAGSPTTAAEPPTDPEADAPDGVAGITGGSGLVVVDVAGKVRRPGIVVLPVGSRVVDALKAAGGVRRGVDLATVNLARLLNDGEQVLIGGPALTGGAGPVGLTGSSTDAGTSAATGGLVNINTADQAMLETLPGVGPVTAAAIIEWRSEHGGFTAVEELLEVSGIGDATLAEIAPHVTI